ncbi:hypothetical protein [Tolumonas lignilytica]|uniref:hypothetical protein n=1 Tax=Tolumonas lignilytica TaxID=1283284 RepID=UPI00046620CD|nr:hypothetical protein [Tolumonas lignilytica]
MLRSVVIHFKKEGMVIFLFNLKRRVISKLFNLAYNFIYKTDVSFNWNNIKLINHGNILFGHRFQAGQGCWLEAVNSNSTITFGDDVTIADWVHIGALDSIVISSGCLLGSKVYISDHYHGNTEHIDAFSGPNERKLYSKGPIVIGRNVWLGDGVVVLPNVKIGDGAIVGANAVVTKDIPAYTIVAGVPARVIRYYETK